MSAVDNSFEFWCQSKTADTIASQNLSCYLIPRKQSAFIHAAQSIGRSKWLSLIPGSEVQPHCNKDGFNVLSQVRIGAVGNNEANCASSESAVGIGISSGSFYCRISTFTGNHACMGDYVVKKVADGFILMQ